MPPNYPPVLGKDFASGSSRIRDLSSVQLGTRDQILASDGDADYETVACPCGSPSSDAVVLTNIDRHGLRCQNVLCRRCGLIRISPRWNEKRYERFYEHEYRALYNRVDISKDALAGTAATSSAVLGTSRWIEKAWRDHGAADQSVRVIEIGAGAGWNLSHLPISWQRIGYDVDRDYIEIGQRLFGVEMRYGLLDASLDAVASAHIVVLSHVVEHFADPEGALRKLAERMDPKALLLIEVPGLFRIHESALDPMAFMQNAHTFTFCGETMGNLCRRAGLSVLEKDETCRIVAHARTSPGNESKAPDSALHHHVLRYLRLCDAGWRMNLKLRAVPVFGRHLAFSWRRGYFPMVGLFKPGRFA